MEAKVKSDIPLETVGRTPRAGVVQKNEVASMKTRPSYDLKIVPGVPKGLRASIRNHLQTSTSRIGRWIDVFLLLINLLACIMFVLLVEGVNQILWLDLTIGCIFLIEYIVRIWVAERRFGYILSWYGFIDLASCIPIFLEISTSTNVGVLKAVQVFRVLRVLRFARFLDDEVFFFGDISKFQLQQVRVIFTVLALIYAAAGFFATLEGPRTNIQTVTSFGESLYFIVITFSTVGYGDITPETDLGRYVISIFILITMVFVPIQVAELIQLTNAHQQVLKGVNGSLIRADCESCGYHQHDRDATHCKMCGSVIFQLDPSNINTGSSGRYRSRLRRDAKQQKTDELDVVINTEGNNSDLVTHVSEGLKHPKTHDR
ncbi:hypothetical protein AAMO2058_000664000 [Amorphochlora amoebiformis]